MFCENLNVCWLSLQFENFENVRIIESQVKLILTQNNVDVEIIFGKIEFYNLKVFLVDQEFLALNVLQELKSLRVERWQIWVTYLWGDILDYLCFFERTEVMRIHLFLLGFILRAISHLCKLLFWGSIIWFGNRSI